MAEVPRTTPASSSPPDESDRLDSWKEIASYLGREVRTVQGWEKNEALPIHRHQHARQGSVFAFRSELDAWRRARVSTPAEPPQDEPPEAEIPPAPAPPPVRSRRKLFLAVAVAVL